MSDSPRREGQLHYAWVVAGLTFLTLLATAGVRATPGVMMVPWEKEYGWNRATISLAISINLILYGLIGPFAAALMDRVGIRRTMIGSLVTVGLGVALSTRMTASWQLILLWGVVVGAGTGMTALVLGATVVNRWFVERRGLVLGVLTASTATGQMVFLPALAAIVTSYKWRPAALVVAGAALMITPLVAFLMRDRPSDVGLLPFGADEGDESAKGVASAPAVDPFAAAIGALRDGLRSRDFWLLAGSFFVCGLSTNGLIGTHLISACLDAGIPEIRAAGLLAAMGLFDLVGTTASGWLSDRYDNRALLCWYYALRGLALIYLPFGLVDSSWGLSAFALFYGLDWIATVPPTVRLTADAFGKQRAAIVFGWIVAAHQIGAAVATFGAGSIRAIVGDYRPAFLTAGAFCLATAALVLQISGPKRKTERSPTVGGEDIQLDPALAEGAGLPLS